MKPIEVRIKLQPLGEVLKNIGKMKSNTYGTTTLLALADVTLLHKGKRRIMENYRIILYNSPIKGFMSKVCLPLFMNIATVNLVDDKDAIKHIMPCYCRTLQENRERKRKKSMDMATERTYAIG